MKAIGKRVLPAVLLCLLSHASQAWGFGDTHRLINLKIYTESSLDEYFDKELAMPLDGTGRIAAKFLGKRPFELVADAGTAEDKPPRRTWNHFHDPLRDWDHAGFTKPLFPDGISNVLWAQYGLVQNHEWLSGPNDEWNWQEAYAYFLSGLTNQDPAVREWTTHASAFPSASWVWLTIRTTITSAVTRSSGTISTPRGTK